MSVWEAGRTDFKEYRWEEVLDYELELNRSDRTEFQREGRYRVGRKLCPSMRNDL